MKRTHKPYQEYFLVAKGNQNLATNGADFLSGNGVALLDGQLGVLDVKTNKFILGNSPTVSSYPAIKLVAGTPTSADFSKNYGWHIGEVKPFLETPIIDRSHTVQSFTASLTPVQSNSAVYIDGVSVPVVSVAATSSVPASVKTYGVNILFRSVRKDRDYGNNIDKLIANYDTPTAANTVFNDYNAANKKSFVLAKLISRINAQSKLNNLQPQWANIAAKKHVIALGINLDGTATGNQAIAGITSTSSINVMTTTNGTLTIKSNAGIVQTLHNFIDKKLLNINAEIVNVNVDTSNDAKIDGILLIALDHDTAVAYDDIYAVKPTIDVTVGGFTTYYTTTVSSAIEPGGSGRLFKIAFDERAFAQYGNHQLTGFADELIKTPSYIDETKSYSTYIIDLYNKDEKFDDSIHHQTRIWILVETTLSTTADAGAGIVPTITETNTVTDLVSTVTPWLNSLTSGFTVNDTGIDNNIANLFSIVAPPSVTEVGSDNVVTATAINGSGVVVTGVNFGSISNGQNVDVTIRAETTGALVGTSTVSNGGNATTFTLVNTSAVNGTYYLKVTDADDSDSQKVVSYKKFIVTA
jgi:hypothetical protein